MEEPADGPSGNVDGAGGSQRGERVRRNRTLACRMLRKPGNVDRISATVLVPSIPLTSRQMTLEIPRYGHLTADPAQ